MFVNSYSYTESTDDKEYLIQSSLFQLLTKYKLMEQVYSGQKQKQKNCEFIDKLIDMMEKYPQHMYWTQDGEQLIINELDEVETKILPDYFRHQNFASFVRQLNMYGFCKKEKRQEFLRFTHKIFKKGNQHNFHLIQRKVKTRNIKNSTTKFYQSNNKIIQVIKTKSGLNFEAQELAVNLLQNKESIQQGMRKIKSQLDKLFLQFKDTRSKEVLETLEFIKKESYPNLVKSLTKGKHIDEVIAQQVTEYRKQPNEAGQVQNDPESQDPELEKQQCSLQNHIENIEESQKCGSEMEYSQRFEMEEGELSAFNQFRQSNKQQQ